MGTWENSGREKLQIHPRKQCNQCSDTGCPIAEPVLHLLPHLPHITSALLPSLTRDLDLLTCHSHRT